MKNLKIGAVVIVSKDAYDFITTEALEKYQKRYGYNTSLIGKIVQFHGRSAVVEFPHGLGFHNGQFGPNVNTICAEYLTAIDLPFESETENDCDEEPNDDDEEVEVTLKIAVTKKHLRDYENGDFAITISSADDTGNIIEDDIEYKISYILE